MASLYCRTKASQDTAHNRMATNKLKHFYPVVIILLLAVITIGSVVAWSKYRSGAPIEISLPPVPEMQATIYVDGAVSNPGSYPVTGSDTIASLIEAAGGTTGGADRSRMRFYIPRLSEGELPQRIDINRADTWLLAALPGIGETRAKAIVEYRRQHEGFRNINELTRVEGIGTATYQQIRPLITVAD